MRRLIPTPSILLALALVGGLVDAASYLGLGQVFTANMTGNTVLLAVDAVRGNGADAARSGVALGGFCLGVALGALLVRRGDHSWPWHASRTLALETAALAVLIGWWAASGGNPRFGLVAVSAVAMGCQSAAVRVSHTAGVNTTYVTGTLTSAIVRFVTSEVRGIPESRRGPTLPGAAVVLYALGALGGGFAERAWHAGAIGAPLAISCIVSVVALSRRPASARPVEG
ncbi:MAG: YoaK family protein [Solirubrobacteraceae bacterium]